jgi:hypothetical protein
MSANIGQINRQWRNNAKKQGATADAATSVIQLRPNELPDYDPKESDADIKKKLKERFEILEAMTEDAISGEVRGLIVSGPPGVGKTYQIDKALEAYDETGELYTTSSGYVKATGLYKLLYKHRFPNQIVKFDDADSVWFDENALNFMKIATDSINKRILTYGAEYSMVDDDGQPIPRSFEFEGSAIFVTNLDFDRQIDRGTKLAPHMEAMISRSHYIDLGMKTKRDYLIRIYMVAEAGFLKNIGLDAAMQKDVLDYIATNTGQLRELSLRMALKIGTLRKSKPATWQRIANLTCCRGIS